MRTREEIESIGMETDEDIHGEGGEKATEGTNKMVVPH